MTLLRQATPQATSEAHDLLMAAAGGGLATAHFLLGAMAEPIGGAPDLESAALHYRYAAEHAHRGKGRAQSRAADRAGYPRAT